MEELFAIVVVVIGVIVKLVEARNKRRAADTVNEAQGVDEPENWQEVFGFPLEQPPKFERVSVPVVKPIMPDTDENGDSGNADWANHILEEQRRYAELAARAEKVNKASIAGESSSIYNSEVSDCDCGNSYIASDWAELIRNNRREALVMSEILSPPIALRK